MKWLLNTLVAVLVLLIAFVVTSFAVGWMNIRQYTDKTAIEIETDKMKDSAGQALDKGKELLDEAKQAVDAEPAPADRKVTVPEST
jgi:hypothetical protein